MPLLFPQWTEVAVTKFLFPIFIFKHEGRWLMCGKRSWVAEKCWRQEVFPVAWRERFLLILLKSYTAGWDCPCTEEEWTQTKACLASYVMEMVKWEAGFFSPLLALCSVMAVAEALDLGAGSKCFAPRSEPLWLQHWDHSEESACSTTSFPPHWCIKQTAQTRMRVM